MCCAFKKRQCHTYHRPSNDDIDQASAADSDHSSGQLYQDRLLTFTDKLKKQM